ncbi:hypothetical protein K457DRAFT_12899 [Linnemannia elongata AG-77]|uniref:Uncharacterized protein n=1 Tax=Linnemannia elongata AG-77 TaxID=1314771 RepID=A0A197KDU5_9FUNG|nr:hypothetical protein K457DRAFT_12899 [Linnemannia elongata AG-77]
MSILDVELELRTMQSSGLKMTLMYPALMENLEAPKSSQEQEKATVILPRFTASQQNSINNVTTIEEVEVAQEVRRQSRKPCRDCENAGWRLRDLHTQELRTKRVYATIAAQQRHKIKKMVLSQSSDGTVLDHQIEASFKSSSVEPDLSKTVVFEDIPDVAAKPEDAKPEAVRCQVTQKTNIATVVLHGAAGTAVESTINGHAKRRGSKLAQQHHIYGPVPHTNENRTSRNPLRPRRRAGRGSMGRDANAANNIAISGASILFSTEHKALPPTVPSPFLQL